MLHEKSAFEKIIEHLPIFIIIVDENMRVKYSNLNIDNISHYSMEKGLGHYISCINSFKSKNKCGKDSSCNNCKIRRIVKETMNTLKPNEDGVEISHNIRVNNNLKKAWFKVQTIPINNDGTTDVIVGITDISDYKEKNQEFIELTKEADAARNAKKTFLANMSHDIRTPLNGIIGMTDLTLATNLTNEQRDNLNIVKNSAYNLLSLINRILEISKFEDDKVSIEYIDFDLEELIKNVIYKNSPQANAKYSKLDYIIDNEIPKILIGDENRLRQVLNNLVSNVVKLTEKSFVIIKIKKLWSNENNLEIEFSIEDLGIGISENEVDFPFETSSQIYGSITKKYERTGLGISISQKLVNLMGGEIKVEARKGIGSRIHFTIKLKEPNKSIEDIYMDIASNKNLKSDKILLVEDSNVNKIIIKKMLNKIGYENVRIASNGIEALKLIQNDKFDIILMDIEMPELNGILTTKIIRQNEKKLGVHTHIIATTACALKGDREKFISEGMDDYISKPIEINELRKVLDRIHNSLNFNDNNIIKEYLISRDSSETDFSSININSKKKLLDKLVILSSYFNDKIFSNINYFEIEKAAHDIKIESEAENLYNIKELAFKIELSARKEDNVGIKTNLAKILTLLTKKN